MLTDFRRSFKPTQEEIERSRRYVESVNAEITSHLIEKGLTEEEITLLEELEGKETQNLRSFQSYSNRHSLLKSGLITVELIKNDIRKYKEGEA
ncbi:hypothetical protein [Paenibacillus sp. M2]|uniref:hypothetical protein n=1 Tax=Paenibacillus sp. M2 TaxID=3341793 RepID=UPI00398A058B